MAQHALREARVLARNIYHSARSEPLEPFVYQTLGALAALGHYARCRAGDESTGAWFYGLVDLAELLPDADAALVAPAANRHRLNRFAVLP
ncbi:MAG: hypothetical protein ACYCUV_15705 [Phycisphaerae bacterium]